MTENESRPLGEIFVRAGVKLVPYAGDSLLMVLDGLTDRRRASASALMRDVAEASGGEENLALRLTDPEMEALFIDGLETAMRTGVAAKRKLLAEVISNAVLDDAKVDSSQLYVMALRDLEAPHIRALARLAHLIQELELQFPSDASQRATFVQKANEQVRKAWNGEPAPVRAALVRTGCVELRRGFIESSVSLDHHLTSFGVELLDDIERHGGAARAGRDE